MRGGLRAAIALTLALAAGCGKKTVPSDNGARAAVPAGPAVGSVLPDGSVRICEDDLLDITFVDAGGLRIGFASGGANTLLRSADGGATWTRIVARDPKGQPLESVRFAGVAEGWASGRDTLLHSADTGRTWTVAARPDGTFFYFGSGCAIGTNRYQLQPPTYGATLFATADGGRTWSRRPGKLPRNDYATVVFCDATNGWIGGPRGMLARTRDAGASWEKFDPPGAPDLTRIQFTGPELGWAAPFYEHQGGPWVTRDGGATWARQDAGVPGSENLVAIRMLDDRTGFVLCSAGADGGQVIRTTDGGATWTRVAKLPAGMNALWFVNEREGWAVGSGGRLVTLRL